MQNQDRTVVVAGATGNQGGAVARHLVRAGFRVRAMTRDPQGSGGRKLAALGAEVVKADFDDAASLTRALEGAYGAYSVQNMMFVGTEKEREQGVAFAEAAARAKVEHFVYSSVGGAERGTGIGHFESKWRIEQRIGELGLPATILRPVFFADNLALPGGFGKVFWGAVAGAIRKDGRRLQVIAVDDIGAFAALAFQRPEELRGRALEIAGDEPTWPEMVDAYRRVKGKAPFRVPLPPWLLGLMDRDLGHMFRWFRDDGYRADIPALRAMSPSLKTFEEALRTADPQAPKK